MPASGPVCVVDFDRTKPVFKMEKLKELLEDVLPNQVFVIGISGAYRTGKSFLLNYLKWYLDYWVQVSLISQNQSSFTLSLAPVADSSVYQLHGSFFCFLY